MIAIAVARHCHSTKSIISDCPTTLAPKPFVATSAVAAMSKIEISMIRDGGCLRPHGDAEWDAFDAIRTSKPVIVTVHQARNPEHHEKLWALATKIADFDVDFLDAEDAIEWAKMHIPNMRTITIMRDGRVGVRTKSISYASMDQIAFGRFYDRALYLWAEKIGCDPETLLPPREQAA
jgi:hypothetical protein